MAQTLPASLDLDESLDSTMGRLRDLFDFDSAVLLLLDETDATWEVARRDGTTAAQPDAHAPAARRRCGGPCRDGAS